MKRFVNQFADMGVALTIWALLIFKIGYHFGTNDHVELLPYVLFLHDHTLFPHDLFIQSLHASLPNERTVFAHLLLPFVNHLPTAIFLLHLFTTVLLLLALHRIAKMFLRSMWLSWLAVLVSVYFLNDRALGGVDLYTNSLQAGDVSVMIIAWALYFWLRERWVLTGVLMIIATYIHVLEGMDVMLVISAVSVLRWLVLKEYDLNRILALIGTYVALAGPYLFMIYRAKTAHASSLSSQELFWILYVFRHPHHFIFATFPCFNKSFFLMYTAAAIWFFGTRSQPILLFVGIAAAALVLYVFAVDFMHLVFAANFQWYKTIQWVKFFGIVAIVGIVAQWLPAELKRTATAPRFVAIVSGGSSLLLIMQLWFSGSMAEGFHSGREAEIAISKLARQKSSVESVFLVPFQFTAMKYYGQRSCYVEFKAIAKNQRDIPEWYRRIQEVYGLDYREQAAGFQMEQQANQNLNHLNAVQLQRLKQEGVTHIICTNPALSMGEKLDSTSNYFLYRL
ncbi:MAG: DUF6798 domain-containing protein [Chitinophagales bacterium]